MLLNFSQILKEYNIESRGIIHVGAHYGHELYLYLRHEIKNILMFEPQEKAFKQLQFNISQINPSYKVNIEAKKIALGNRSGEADMFVEEANRGMSSSILEPALVAVQYPHITFENKEQVKMDTLDNYLGSSEKYDFINIDVQGYELEVFKGASKTLEKISYIITEVNREELYKGCVKVDELDSFLGEFGFSREVTDWEGQTWGDAFYLKRE